VKLSFYVGAAAFLGAVLWTILTTKELPTGGHGRLQAMKASKMGIGGGLAEIKDAHSQHARHDAPARVGAGMHLVRPLLHVAVLPVAVARNVFGAPNEARPSTRPASMGWALLRDVFGRLLRVLVLPAAVAARLGRRNTPRCACSAARPACSRRGHPRQVRAAASMTGVGIAWAGILSMPYAILAGSLPPQRTGVYMGSSTSSSSFRDRGVFGFGWVMAHLLDNNRLAAVVAGGIFLALARCWCSGCATRSPTRPRPAADPRGRVTSSAIAVLFMLAAAPDVTKVEPPGWWPGHSINPVRVLVRGHNLAGARVESAAGLRSSNVRVNGRGRISSRT